MDADETRKDALPDGGQPSTDEQKPSEEALKTLADAIEKAADEKHSKLDQMKGKAEKEATTLKGSLATLQEKHEQLLKEKADREVKMAQDDPEKLGLIQAQKKHREMEAEIERLTKRERELSEQVGEGAKVKTQTMAEKIGEKYSVDADTLIRLTDGSEEKMTVLAETLAKVATPKVTEPPLTPDSGLGGGVGPTMPDSAKDKIKAGWGELHK